jgi:hypothetical protein
MELKDIFKIAGIIFILCILLVVPYVTSAKVSETKHNLSVSGPGPIKAVEETQICIFCHTPHSSESIYPLWNHEVSSFQSYINYWSPTLQAYDFEEAPPIDGFSKLCLSCHDGTIAIGAVLNREEDILMSPSPYLDAQGRLLPGAKGYLGTDLSGGHPISFIFDEFLAAKRNDAGLTKLNWPISDNDVKLYPTQGGYGVQCPSCHDPHNNKAAGGWPPFWRKETHDEVCMVCHDSEIPEGVIEW